MNVIQNTKKHVLKKKQRQKNKNKNIKIRVLPGNKHILYIYIINSDNGFLFEL